MKALQEEMTYKELRKAWKEEEEEEEDVSKDAGASEHLSPCYGLKKYTSLVEGAPTCMEEQKCANLYLYCLVLFPAGLPMTTGKKS